MKIIVAIILTGLTAGIVGGLFIGPTWFHGGLVTTIVGIALLLAYALSKRPDAVMNMSVSELDDMQTIPLAPPRVDPLTTEHEFRLSDKQKQKTMA